MLAFRLLLAVALTCAVATASIESSSPIKVTNKNSGPRYDVDLVERTKIEPEEAPTMRPLSPVSGETGTQDQEEPSIGRISIRRIFLVPMMTSQQSPPMDSNPWSARGGELDQSNGNEDTQAPQRPPFRHRHFLLGGPSERDEERVQQPRNPFWHFSAPPPPSNFHMFGQDQASRSPPAPQDSADNEDASESRKKPAGGEHLTPEEIAAREQLQSALMNPIQMMIDMMNQALQSSLQPTAKPGTTGGAAAAKSDADLNKEASQSKPSGGSDERGSGKELEQALKPLNETREDIVEIDGKKYVRKTIVNRHVGENIVFMTRRLVFVPLNETSGETTSTAAPASEPISTTTLATSSELPAATEIPKRPAGEETTSTTSAPTSTASNWDAPTTTTTTSTTTTTAASTTGAAKPEEMTTSNSKNDERPSNERLMDSSTSTTTSASASTSATN